MDISQTAIRLGIPESTRLTLQSVRILPEREEQLKQLFRADVEAFVKHAYPLEILWLYLRWTKNTKEAFDCRNIPETVFWDSMTDIGIWCRDYYKKTGLPGIGEPQWVAKSLKLEVIRLGRLQFEPGYLDQVVQAGQRIYPAGTPILHVHIPAEEKLKYESVLDSLNQTKDFFKKYFDFVPVIMHCHSWLLSPELKKLLPEDSNILRFQNLFCLYKTDDLRQAEERVFGAVQEEITSYPQKTTLQKKMKTYLLKGHKIGMGWGIIPIATGQEDSLPR